MKSILFLFVLINIAVSSATAQNQFLSEDLDKVYWQPKVAIDYADFQSPSTADCVAYNEKYGLQMSANIQLKGIVDIPTSHLSKNVRKRTGNDKLYLAPVFCKDCSCILAEDSVELVVNQLLFDVAEMSARGLRRELSETQQDMKINNVNTMFFSTAMNKWDESMREVWASIYQDVLIQKKDNAYLEWRALVDELLAANEDFATQPYEVERLSRGEPIEKGYVQAETILSDLEK